VNQPAEYLIWAPAGANVSMGIVPTRPAPGGPHRGTGPERQPVPGRASSVHAPGEGRV